MAEKLGRVARSQREDIWILLDRGRKDLGRGGAQAWFPQRFPQLKRVDVFMTIEGVSFRGRAEIVGPDQHGKAEVQGGLCWHNLRWVTLHAQEMAALSSVAPGA